MKINKFKKTKNFVQVDQINATSATDVRYFTMS